MNPKTRLFLILTTLAFGLTACGQRGPLTLPDHKTESVKKEETVQKEKEKNK